MNANTQKSKSCSLKATRSSWYRCILEYITAPRDNRTEKKDAHKFYVYHPVVLLWCTVTLQYGQQHTSVYVPLCLYHLHFLRCLSYYPFLFCSCLLVEPLQ